ncbi:MAG: tetratricopeptide repeat protein [Pedobacter sp.]
MTWTALSAYGLEFLPRFSWYVSGSGAKCAFLGLFLFGMPVLYLPLWWAVKTWLPSRKYSLLRLFAILVWGGFFFGIFNLNEYFQAIPFAPVYLFIGIVAIGTAMAIALSGAWLFIKSESKAPPFFSYLRANLWLSWFSSGHFLLPIILFNVPIFDHSRGVVYVGMLVMMLLVYLTLLFLIWPKLVGIFGLSMDQSQLSEDCRRKFVTASAPIRQRNDCTIEIAKPGLLNAVALYSQKKIVVGADLIRGLEAGELQAVLTHELGHLQDPTFLPKIRRYSYGMDACVWLFFICIHTQVFAITTIGIVLIGLMLLFAQYKNKQTRLQAELYADRFVKSTDEDLWGHLISGLEKVRAMNGLDENFCKRHNFAHLDTDERIAGVCEGKQIKRSVPGRKMLRLMVAWLLIGGFFAVIANYLPPSDSERWTRLHKAYHAQRRQQNDQRALVSIKQALQLSLDKFGRYSSKTYISLNDLTEYMVSSGQWEDAEIYGLQALATGEQLYANKDLKVVRSLKNLGRVYFNREDYAKALETFIQARKVQEDLADDAWGRSDTLEWMIYSLGSLNRTAETKPLFEAVLELYRGLGEEGRGAYLQALEDFSESFAGQGDYESSRLYAEKALGFARSEFGEQSEEYAYALLSDAQGLKSAGTFDQAKARCHEALGLLKSLFGPESEEYGDASGILADIHRQAGDLEQAAQNYLARLHIYENLYGKDSSYLIGDLWELGLIAEARSEWAAAEAYFSQVDVLEGQDDDVKPDSRLKTYEKLLAVLSKLGKTGEAKIVERKMQDIGNKAAANSVR